MQQLMKMFKIVAVHMVCDMLDLADLKGHSPSFTYIQLEYPSAYSVIKVLIAYGIILPGTHTGVKKRN